MTRRSWGWPLAQVCTVVTPLISRSCGGPGLANRSDPHMRNTTLSMALVAVLGCGAQLNETGNGDPGTGATGNAAAANGARGNGATGDGATGNGASADARADTIAPVACDPTFVEAGASSMSDADVPLNHRPTPACCPAQRGPAPAGQPYPT